MEDFALEGEGSFVRVSMVKQKSFLTNYFVGEQGAQWGTKDKKEMSKGRSEGNYNKVDHMIAAKRAWSLYKKKKAAFITWA